MLTDILDYCCIVVYRFKKITTGMEFNLLNSAGLEKWDVCERFQLAFLFVYFFLNICIFNTQTMCSDGQFP